MRSAIFLAVALLLAFGCIATPQKIGVPEKVTVRGTIDYHNSSIPHVVLTVFSPDPNHLDNYSVISTHEFSNGSFEVSAPPHSHVLLEDDRGQRILATVSVEPVQSMYFSFSKPFVLNGVVTPGANISLYSQGVLLHSTIAQPNGAFSLSPVQAGTYSLVGRVRSENLTRIIPVFITGGSNGWLESTSSSVLVPSSQSDLVRLNYGPITLHPLYWYSGLADFGKIPVGDAVLEIFYNGKRIIRNVTVSSSGGIIE